MAKKLKPKVEVIEKMYIAKTGLTARDGHRIEAGEDQMTQSLLVEIFGQDVIDHWVETNVLEEVSQ